MNALHIVPCVCVYVFPSVGYVACCASQSATLVRLEVSIATYK